MRITANISVDQLSAKNIGVRLLARLEKARTPVHRAMAGQFRQCTLDNFGASGSFRPHQWAKLSPRYARKVGRDYATLNVTGKLRSAIKMSANSDKGKVSVSSAECDYALAHQFGYDANNLPARPYFPIYTNGEIMWPVQRLVKNAAQLALTANLRNK